MDCFIWFVPRLKLFKYHVNQFLEVWKVAIVGTKFARQFPDSFDVV